MKLISFVYIATCISKSRIASTSCLNLNNTAFKRHHIFRRSSPHLLPIISVSRMNLLFIKPFSMIPYLEVQSGIWTSLLIVPVPAEETTHDATNAPRFPRLLFRTIIGIAGLVFLQCI